MYDRLVFNIGSLFITISPISTNLLGTRIGFKFISIILLTITYNIKQNQLWGKLDDVFIESEPLKPCI